MKQKKDLPDAYVLDGKTGTFFFIVAYSGLRMLDVPIAKVVPEETVYAPQHGVELVVFVKRFYFVASLCKTKQDGLVIAVDLVRFDAPGNQGHFRIVDEVSREESESANVPKFVAKIPSLFDAVL